MKQLGYIALGCLTLTLMGTAIKWWDDDDAVYHTASLNEPLPVQILGVQTEAVSCPGSCTVDPSTGQVVVTCTGDSPCTVTIGETNAYDGLKTCIICSNDTNDGTETCDISDSPAVSNLSGNASLDDDDILCMNYETDHYVEKTRSNN